MENESILEFLKTLKSQRAELDITIKMIEGQLLKNGLNIEKQPIVNGFPLTSRPEKQSLYLFENVIKKAIKMPDINKLFKSYKEISDGTIYNSVRFLKDRGNIVLVKYNNSNAYGFYGLPVWLNDEKSDFKDEFKPNEDDLPLTINRVEIVVN